MSGPATTAEGAPRAATPAVALAPTLEVAVSRETIVGGIPVRRALPRRARRTVGAWCFADHFGPVDAAATAMAIGPHPHIGLQTVTWLLDGEVLHRDSLGSEQLIRPGQLNLMTAGWGVAHAEETLPGAAGSLHGVQLWVALPSESRDGAAAFEHHAELPTASLAAVTATVLVGAMGDARSPARADTPLMGADLVFGGGPATVPLDPTYEHGLVGLVGDVDLDGAVIGAGSAAYLGLGREELTVQASPGARVLLLGGTPFAEPVLMWWNFVARTTAEIEQAFTDWEAGDRFGDVASPLPRMSAPRPHWMPDRP